MNKFTFGMPEVSLGWDSLAWVSVVATNNTGVTLTRLIQCHADHPGNDPRDGLPFGPYVRYFDGRGPDGLARYKLPVTLAPGESTVIVSPGAFAPGGNTGAMANQPFYPYGQGSHTFYFQDDLGNRSPVVTGTFPVPPPNTIPLVMGVPTLQVKVDPNATAFHISEITLPISNPSGTTVTRNFICYFQNPGYGWTVRGMYSVTLVAGASGNLVSPFDDSPGISVQQSGHVSYKFVDDLGNSSSIVTGTSVTPPPPPVGGMLNLQGTVTDNSTGHPLAGVTVTLGGSTTTTDSAGIYAFSAALGSYTIHFHKADYLDVNRSIVLAADSQVDIWMDPGAGPKPVHESGIIGLLATGALLAAAFILGRKKQNRR